MSEQEVGAVAWSVLEDCIVQELLDEFFDSERCGVELTEIQARLLAVQVMRRVSERYRHKAR